MRQRFNCLFEEESDNLKIAKHKFVPETSLCHIPPCEL